MGAVRVVKSTVEWGIVDSVRNVFERYGFAHVVHFGRAGRSVLLQVVNYGISFVLCDLS